MEIKRFQKIIIIIIILFIFSIFLFNNTKINENYENTPSTELVQSQELQKIKSCNTKGTNYTYIYIGEITKLPYYYGTVNNIDEAMQKAREYCATFFQLTDSNLLYFGYYFDLNLNLSENKSNLIKTYCEIGVQFAPNVNTVKTNFTYRPFYGYPVDLPHDFRYSIQDKMFIKFEGYSFQQLANSINYNYNDDNDYYKNPKIITKISEVANLVGALAFTYHSSTGIYFSFNFNPNTKYKKQTEGFGLFGDVYVVSCIYDNIK
jgi:hypothetical protein